MPRPTRIVPQPMFMRANAYCTDARVPLERRTAAVRAYRLRNTRGIEGPGSLGDDENCMFLTKFIGALRAAAIMPASTVAANSERSGGAADARSDDDAEDEALLLRCAASAERRLRANVK